MKKFAALETGDIICVDIRSDGHYASTYLYEIFPLALMRKGYKFNEKFPNYVNGFNFIDIDYEMYCKIYNLTPVYEKPLVEIELTPMEKLQETIEKRKDIPDFKYYKLFKKFLDDVTELNGEQQLNYWTHIFLTIERLFTVELLLINDKDLEFLNILENAFKSEETVLSKNAGE